MPVLLLALSLVFVISLEDPKPEPTRLKEARATLESLVDEDSKLRASYRELHLEHKRLSGMATTAAACKAASINLRDPAARSANGAEAHRLQGLIDAAKPNYDKMESEFKEKQNELLAKANAIVPTVKSFGETSSKENVADLLQFTELFMFDSKHEMPNVQASASFIDQAAWKAATKALAKQGKGAIPALKKALGSTSVGTKYAAAVALGELGPVVHEVDKNIVTLIGDIKSKTHNTVMLDRTEKNRRTKVLADAMDSIRPSK